MRSQFSGSPTRLIVISEHPISTFRQVLIGENVARKHPLQLWEDYVIEGAYEDIYSINIGDCSATDESLILCAAQFFDITALYLSSRGYC